MSKKSFILPEALKITTVNIDPCKGVFVLFMSYKNLANTKTNASQIIGYLCNFWEKTFPDGYPRILVLDKTFGMFDYELIRHPEEFNELKKFIITLQSRGFLLVVVNGERVSPFYTVAQKNVAYLNGIVWDGYAASTIYYEPEEVPISTLPEIPKEFSGTDRHLMFGNYTEALHAMKLIKKLNSPWRIVVKSADIKYPQLTEKEIIGVGESEN